MITNAFSVDVEEYYHAEIFRAGTGAMASRSYESRVERSVDRLLELLDRHDALGTFFVLGEIAADHPNVVRRIAALGHEIGCHGDHHENVSSLTPTTFRADLRRAKARIEAAVGTPVVGYRAPNFSIGPREHWAYEILSDEGFQYDSSVFPIIHDRYGQADAPRFPYVAWHTQNARLLEFPIGTLRVMRVNVPIGGGGYFRLCPLGLTRAAIQHVNIRERRPLMFYLHPWELDSQQPRPRMPWKYRFRHYVGLEQQPAKLDRLLAHFAFRTARHVLDTWTSRLASAAMADAHAHAARLGLPA